MQRISESGALAIINSAPEFKISFVTANVAAQTGGRIIESNSASRIGSSHDEMEHGTITLILKDHGDKKVTVHRKLIKYLNGQKVIC